MHYRVPDTFDEKPQDLPDPDVHVAEAEKNLLRTVGAFSLPPSNVQILLLQAYFRWLHPSQHILDKDDFWKDYEAGRASLLLLHGKFLQPQPAVMKQS